MNQKNDESRFGYVAIVGRPNVGKSTLLNHFLGRKLSITSRKPQTTRHRIMGIKTLDNVQIVYVDTPGLHQSAKREMNRYMNRAARSVLHEVDLILFVVDATQWTQEDKWILNQLKEVDVPVMGVVNKIDKLNHRELLLPYMEELAKQFEFHQIIPTAAVKGDQVEALEQQVIACLPKEMPCFPPEQFTDRSDRFIATEMIREKLMRSLGQELPYALTVTIEAFEEEDDIIRMSAIIWVEKQTQKVIVIGKQGERLKKVGQSARLDMETYFNKKIFVKLWVKVKTGWSDDGRALRGLGYEE